MVRLNSFWGSKSIYRTSNNFMIRIQKYHCENVMKILNFLIFEASVNRLYIGENAFPVRSSCGYHVLDVKKRENVSLFTKMKRINVYLC